MMPRINILVVTLTALLTGCGTWPMTAAEFRTQASESSTADKDTFVVRRPFAAVARTFEKKAAECLNYTVNITSRQAIGGGSRTVTEQAKATVIITAKKAELSFQVKPAGYSPDFHNGPPDGLYFLVADAYPVDRNRTKVDIVRGGVDVVAHAIRAWANGKDRGCPDPTKVFPR